MQTDDINLTQLDDTDLINEYDDLEHYDQEGDLEPSEELDHMLDRAATGEFDQPAVDTGEGREQGLRVVETDEIGQANDRAKSSINDLPIKVTAQVGMFSMPLGELENLSEGDLIQVSPDYQNKVSLQVAGTEIGIGEIVSINGDVAIQVTRLWS
ncbi:MAG: FliM/FliN family flagellar motor switch protein [Acidiferrobacterales bacterium]|nr:FliM/FliN family flagellar motor switch protein [Acidiferrobacterales bacterium]